MPGLRSRGHRTLREWGVVSQDIGLLGGSWFESMERWPQRFKTRPDARAAAQALRDKYRYLRPACVWEFRAVRLRITMDWT